MCSTMAQYAAKLFFLKSKFTLKSIFKFYTNSKSVFLSKGSPVSVVHCVLCIDQFKGPRNFIFKYLGHKMSSSNYEFGPL